MVSNELRPGEAAPIGRNRILERMKNYKFYHIIKVEDGITTPGNPDYVPAQNLCLKHLETLDLQAKRVLDIGCRDGLFCFKAESMGAAEVIGIDNDLSEPATQFLIPFFNSKVKMKQLNLYDLLPDTFGLFDAVIFASVLSNLRYPFWGLKVIRNIMNIGGHLLVETAIWQREPDKSMLLCPTNQGPWPDDTTACTFFNEKGLRDTLESLGFETVCIEYLEYKRRAWQLIKHEIKEKLKGALHNIGLTRTSVHITPCVFHLVYRGYDQNSFTTKYWEKIHDYHTRHGG